MTCDAPAADDVRRPCGCGPRGPHAVGCARAKPRTVRPCGCKPARFHRATCSLFTPEPPSPKKQRSDLGPFRVRAVGPVRASSGQKHAYGSIAPRVREILDRDGVVEPRKVARELGVSLDSLCHIFGRPVRGVPAPVQVFRGVWALPEVAEAIRAGIDAANDARRSKP